MSAAEIMPCPFLECGGKCRLEVVQGWLARQGIYCDRCSYRLLCDAAPGGGYARLTTVSEAIAAHNALCRKVALHGELVEALNRCRKALRLEISVGIHCGRSESEMPQAALEADVSRLLARIDALEPEA